MKRSCAIQNGSAPHLRALPGRTTARLFTFNGTRKKATSDSAYKYEPGGAAPFKTTYNERQVVNAVNNAAHNKSYTQLAYAYKGDIYLVDVLLNKTTRITQTADYESNPVFVLNGEAIAYQKGDDLLIGRSRQVLRGS